MRARRIAAELVGSIPLKHQTDAESALAYFLSDTKALDRLLVSASTAMRPRSTFNTDVDELVERAMSELYGDKVEASLLKKGASMGSESQLLLGVLMGRLGEEISLRELLVINEFHTATSRRIRELRNEHGGFDIEVRGSGSATTYVLRSNEPDLRKSADWWLKRNIRESSLTPHEKLLAVLSAYVTQPVPVAEIGEVLPEARSRGKGRPRASQRAVTRRIRELRDLGYVVRSTPSGYVLADTEPGEPLEAMKPSTRNLVLERDDYSCTRCGWKPGMKHGVRPRELQVHHLEPKRMRPDDVHNPAKLVTLCSWCHAGEEAELKRLLTRSASGKKSIAAP